MKTILISALLFFINFSTYSQKYKKNNCSEDLEITFLDKDDAEWETKNHSVARNYLNIKIDAASILYWKGRS
ncbi:MAG: hypothetical protein V3U92_06625 [Cellulophaga sp.]